MSNSKSVYLFTFTIIFFICHFTSVYSAQNDAVMFVFGDSLFDPGNNNYVNLNFSEKADHPPYGLSFFNFSTGRYCDGRIIPDFIAMDMKLPLWEAYLGPNETHLNNYTNGVNFASGGARVISPTNRFINLEEQLNFFRDVAEEMSQQKGEKEANEILKRAIYFSSIGGVDYQSFFEFTNSSQSQRLEFVNMVITNFTNIIKEIYEMGGRKFAFQNVGPMGCVPGMKEYFGIEGDECVEGVSQLVELHNDALLKVVADLETQLDGFKYSVFDYYTALSNMIQNHTQYGFKIVDSACCGQGPTRGSNCGIEPYELCKNVSEYLFFDGYHTTQRANSILSEFMWNDKSTLSVPYNFKQLYELNITSNHYISLATKHINIVSKNVTIGNNYFL